MVVDRNNNLDLSDDEPFVPYKGMITDSSLAQEKAIEVSYELFLAGKPVSKKADFLIMDFEINGESYITYTVPRYAMADFNGFEIAVIPYAFVDVTLDQSEVALLHGRSPGERLIVNSYLNIKDTVYQYVGVNEKEHLVLKKVAPSELENDYSHQVGFQLRPFSNTNLATQAPLTLKQFRGKYVFIDFWATWCVPCLKEMPINPKFMIKTDRKDFEIIGIVGHSKPDEIKKSIEELKMTWPTAFPEDSEKMRKDYNIAGYPTSFLLDPQGKIIAKGLRGNGLDKKLRELGLMKH